MDENERNAEINGEEKKIENVLMRRRQIMQGRYR